MIDRFVKQLADRHRKAGSLSDVDATMHTLGIGYRAETAEKHITGGLQRRLASKSATENNGRRKRSKLVPADAFRRA